MAINFNRTILELKLVCSVIFAVTRNNFNRTILELKHTYGVRGCFTTIYFNRTILELKRQDVIQVSHANGVL